jgi:peptidyl-dipeptidase Dcp
MPASAATAPVVAVNPLLAEWTGPYGGVPAFDQLDLAALEPAMDIAIRDHLAELDAIAADPNPPSFANTIVAMERSGQPLERVFAYYGVWSSNLSTPEFREVQARLAPKLAQYSTAVVQHAALFARIAAVRQGPEFAGLSGPEQRLVQLTFERFARQGASLEGAARARYAAIQEELAQLHTRFANNVLADEEEVVTFLREDQLGGLSPSFVAAAKAAAAARGKSDGYAITNTRSAVEPFLTYSTDRGLREQVWRAYVQRGDRGDAHDNKALVAAILALRHERSALLGYPNYATWRLEDRMAKTPERALELMMQVWPAAIARAKQEVADMQRVADREAKAAKVPRFAIEAWDYRHYAEKVRLSRYALDSDEVSKYLELERLREAMFMVAGELFGLSFEPVAAGEVPVFHESVRVWRVSRGGELVGLWYLDPFARPGKRSGAWATSYRGRATVPAPTTVLSSNNSNFIAGAPGEPVLVSWDDARTFFHEFGHALHALTADVDYPTLNGGVRDYTEFQSQLLERWLLTDRVIDGYLRHVDTGAPMPAELVAKLRKAATFNQGFATAEYLASAIIDLKLHMIDPAGLDPAAFERDTLAELGMPPQIVMRHRIPHFGHVFSGEGYAAGYYGYLWADVLTADAAEAFADAPGGLYDAALAKRLREHLFAPRNAVDPAEAYRAFRGRDATIDALMRDRGFPVPRPRPPGSAPRR